MSCIQPLWVGAQERTSIEIGRLSGPGISLENINAQLGPRGVELTIEKIQDRENKPVLSDLSAHCTDGLWSAKIATCSSGDLQFGAALSSRPIKLTGQFGWLAPDQPRFTGDIQIAEIRSPASLTGRLSDALLELELPATAVSNLSQAFPWLRLEGIEYQSGELSGALAIHWPERPDSLTFRGQITDFSFDSDDGLQAAAGLGARFSLSLNPYSESMDFKLDSRFNNGELLLSDFYTRINEQPRELRLNGKLTRSGWQIASLELDDPGVLRFKGAAQFDPDFALLSLTADQLELRLPAAFDNYFGGLLASTTLAALTTGGRISGSFAWRSRQPPVLALELTGLILDDPQSRFFINGLDGEIKLSPRLEVSELRWQQARLFRLPLERGQIRLDMSHKRVSLAQPLVLGMLGGQLRLNQFLLEQAFSQNPDLIGLNAEMVGLSMPSLSRALGWPEMGGTLSGKIPSLSVVDGVASLGGELLFQVFDGRVSVSQLSVERPFGVLPTLAASIQLENLDLEQLSGAFSFGRITGRLNGAIQELRMQNWQPAAFEAWFETPSKYRGSKKISQRAVENIASIGGGGPGAALSGPLLGMFDEFSYKRIGLRCRLQNNVCQMGGLDGSDPPFRIIEGAGIPRITVLGFNSMVDWPQLVAELKAATQSTGPKTSRSDGA